MKKIYLTKTQQFNELSYTGSIDPRILVKMVDQSIDGKQVRADQRPLDKSHMLKISKHVGEERGLLPTSVIVGTREKNKLKIETELSTTGETLYYMMIPNTDQEFKNYKNTIDISDGQHRVFSFSDKYRNSNLKDSDVYEVPVTFFIMPQLITRQKLFYTTNAMQKSVSPNLLMWLRDKLNLLSKPEETYLPLIRLLNSENLSPLQNRIILSSEKIKKGYKAKELVKIFNKAKIADIGVMTSQQIDDNMMVKILSDYLSGWEKRYQLSFQHPNNDIMTKISGIRYILLLLPTFIELSVTGKKDFTPDYVEEIIKELEAAKKINTIESATLFSEDSLSFRGEGATVKLAENDAKTLKAHMANKQTKGFNPFSRQNK